MFYINTLNNISNKGLIRLSKDYTLIDQVEDADAVIVRSAKMHDLEFSQKLLTIARAGAGVNNIPVEKCSEQGIVVFNTPGANANAVKELVIAGLLLASRRVSTGIEWVKSVKDKGDEIPKLVEKEKSNFAGPEIYGKKLGVVGLGAIGVMVANAAASLGMEVIGFDPFISVESAWGLSRNVIRGNNLEELLSQCDYITIHVPLMENTKNMINKEKFATMKKGVRLLNFSRGGLVNDEDLLVAIEEGIISCYVTDFPNKSLIDKENIICIPHLGASTPESEENCAVMAVDQLRDYLENGNITNSVNYPDCSLGVCNTKCRITINHKNVPTILGQITNILAVKNINIADMNNRSKGSWAYTALDVDTLVNSEVIQGLNSIDGVVRVRIITKEKTL